MYKFRLHLHFNKVLYYFNLPFSLFLSLSGLLLHQDAVTGLVHAFSISLLTGGFFISVYLFEKRYNKQYFFYYNAGISKAELIIGAFISNLAIVLILLFLKSYLYV